MFHGGHNVINMLFRVFYEGCKINTAILKGTIKLIAPQHFSREDFFSKLQENEENFTNRYLSVRLC